MVTFDPLDHIRSHPQRYLPGGKLDGLWLAQNLVSDVRMQDGSNVAKSQVDGWWVVVSDTDWIALLERRHHRDPFTSILPFPEAGPNSMHGEVLLTAFAEAVLTADREGPRVVKGQVAPDDPIWSRLSGGTWSRAVAFRVPV
jgi:hypothetical protein